jgi:two-component system OmpR family response regulator
VSENQKELKIYSAMEVAKLCGVVNQTAINWIKNGYLAAFTTPGGQYRVYSDDLYGFMKQSGMRIPLELEKLHKNDVKDEKIVLIVDDDLDFNNILKDYFQAKLPEIKIVQATDGFQAGRLVTTYKPALIILDIKLPGVDGYTLCQNIKSDHELKNPYIIAISGVIEHGMEKIIFDKGADAFFYKPFKLEDLVEKAESFLRQT